MEHKTERKILKMIGFVILSVILFGIVLVLMISSDERWYAYLILAACAGSLIILRKTKFWYGWRVPLYWILTLVIAWGGLFAGQPPVDIQPYTAMNLEQPSASYKLLLNNVTVVDTRTGNLTSNVSLQLARGRL